MGFNSGFKGLMIQNKRASYGISRLLNSSLLTVVQKLHIHLLDRPLIILVGNQLDAQFLL